MCTPVSNTYLRPYCVLSGARLRARSGSKPTSVVIDGNGLALVPIVTMCLRWA